MTLRPLTKHHLESLSLKGGCTGSYESTLAKYHIVGNHTVHLLGLAFRDKYVSISMGTEYVLPADMINIL